VPRGTDALRPQSLRYGAWDGTRRVDGGLGVRVCVLSVLTSRFLRSAVRLKTRARWLRFGFMDTVAGRAPRLRCPICLYDGRRRDFREYLSRDRFLGGRLLRHECPSCDVIFGTQRMLALGPGALAREYRELYAVYDEGETTPFELEAFRHLGARRGGRYLNYGSGRWSKAIPLLRSQGFDLLGFEPFSRSDSGDPAILSDSDRLRSMRFDGVMTQSLIEHLVDPVGTLRLLAGLLRDDAAPMVHATNCYRYELEFSRFHLFFFVGRSIRVAAARAGLRVEDTENPDVKRFYRIPERAPSLTPDSGRP